LPDEGFQSKSAPLAVAQRPSARRSLVLAACMMATFMAAVESSIVATAMPTIVAELGGFNLFSWVFAIYLLTQAVSIPVYGRLADIYGRKTVFYVGAGLFLVGSTLCGFAGNMLTLILFRALQGFGAGGVQPIATTILGDIYAPTERAHVQGLGGRRRVFGLVMAIAVEDRAARAGLRLARSTRAATGHREHDPAGDHECEREQPKPAGDAPERAAPSRAPYPTPAAADPAAVEQRAARPGKTAPAAPRSTVEKTLPCTSIPVAAPARNCFGTPYAASSSSTV